MILQIMSPEGLLLSAKVNSVTLPGAEGSFTVLNGHAPLLSTLTRGVIHYDSANDPYPIESGTVEVKDNMVTVYIA